RCVGWPAGKMSAACTVVPGQRCAAGSTAWCARSSEQLSGTHERGCQDGLANHEAGRVVHGESEVVAVLVDDEDRDTRWHAGQRHRLDGATDGLLQLGKREVGAVVRKGTPRHGLTGADQHSVRWLAAVRG